MLSCCVAEQHMLEMLVWQHAHSAGPSCFSLVCMVHTGCFALSKVEGQAMERRQWCSVLLEKDVSSFP